MFTGLLTLKLPVDVRGHTTLAACCPGLELPDITAVSSSKMSRLCPSLCVALQPTPHHVSAVSGLTWCACSQPHRLGAHARFHAVHASSCLLLSSTSCCTDNVLVRERLLRDVKAKCLLTKKTKQFVFLHGLTSKVTTYDSFKTGSKMFFLGQIGSEVK